MSLHLQLLLPSLVLPLLLSGALYGLSRRDPRLAGALPLIWLPSVFWLVGWPKLVPEQTSDWLWHLAVVSAGLSLGVSQRPRASAWAQTGLMALVLVVMIWPVLRYQPSRGLAFELAAVLAGAVVVLFNAARNPSAAPALALAVSAGGLGVVTALDGSLLVGQLAVALASVCGVFALVELYERLAPGTVGVAELIPLAQVYLALLLIARVYAEIPLASSALLLMAPVVGSVPGSRFAVLGSVASVGGALGWVLLTADAPSYY
jgi:hypothetical protein